MPVVVIPFRNERITPSELADGKKTIKTNRKPQTNCKIFIKARDTRTNEVLAECESNVFTSWSHSKYLEKNLREQRRTLHHRHVDPQRVPEMEKANLPVGFGLSRVGSQQVSERIFTGRFVRFPILYFGNVLRGDVSAKVEITLFQMSSPYPDHMNFPLEDIYPENDDLERSRRLFSELGVTNYVPESQNHYVPEYELEVINYVPESQNHYVPEYELEVINYVPESQDIQVTNYLPEYELEVTNYVPESQNLQPDDVQIAPIFSTYELCMPRFSTNGTIIF